MTVPAAPCVLPPPVSCVPFLPVQFPQACRRVSPQAGRASLEEGGGGLCVTRDKDPLGSPCISHDPHFQSQRGEWCGGGAEFTCTQCYFRFIAVFECVFVFAHTPRSPLLMWPISSHAVSVLVYPRRCWLFPQECVCVDRGHFLASVCVS